MFDGRWQGIKRDLDLSANQVREHGSGAAIWNVEEVHACRHLEQLTCHMSRSSHAGRCEVELAWIAFGISDEFRDCLHRHRWVDLHDKRRFEDAGNGSNVAQKI